MEKGAHWGVGKTDFRSEIGNLRIGPNVRVDSSQAREQHRNQRAAKRLLAFAIVAALSLGGGYGIGKVVWGAIDRLVDKEYAATIFNWQSSIEKKLAGEEKLKDDEQIYNGGEIIAGGRTLEDAEDMKRRGQEVNVRNYPAGSIVLKGIFERQTEIVGTAKPGTPIEGRLVLTYGRDVSNGRPTLWAATACSNIIPEKKGICAVNALYTGNFVSKS